MAFWQKQKTYQHLTPDEIFLDTGNLPEFETDQFEGVIEKPIHSSIIIFFGVFLALAIIIVFGRIFYLQVFEGERYLALSRANNLEHKVLFTERGVLYDRNQKELAWNKNGRAYLSLPGFAHLLGYVGYPTEEEISEYEYHPKELLGREGVERIYNNTLRGRTGLQIVEVDVTGSVLSEAVLAESVDGENITLSVDSRLQTKLFSIIRDLARERGFSGGSGIMMDVHTGEIVALSNYPEYSPQMLSQGASQEYVDLLRNDKGNPFLNRAIQGVYTPGSIFKPFIALAALQEKIISPEKVIFTNGSLQIPNPYVPGEFTEFPDWKNHGPVTMLDAIAVSSNVYFFQLGGGYTDQRGLGIERIERYAKMFGFGKNTESGFIGEEEGLIPTPQWKKETFNDDWRIGDTYNSSIGQYGFGVTPLQVVRAVSVIANGGTLIKPTLIAGVNGSKHDIDIDEKHLSTVSRGMREAVIRGTATGLFLPDVSIAAKTGTAEIDVSKTLVNSWVMGFFPYENPRYAFTVVMERGPRENYIGGVFAVRQLVEWMLVNTPEYFTEEPI